MLQRNLFLCLLSVTALMSCDKTSDGQSDCQRNDYGILRVSYADTSVVHSIQASLTSMGGRTKFTPKGQSSDTMHLTSANYIVTIRSHNTVGGPALNTKSVTPTINQCVQSNESTSF